MRKNMDKMKIIWLEIGKSTTQNGNNSGFNTNLRRLAVVDLCKRTCMDIVVACIVLACELLDIPIVPY